MLSGWKILLPTYICHDNYIIGVSREMALSDSIMAVIATKFDSMLLFSYVKARKYLEKAGMRGQGAFEFTVLSSLESHNVITFSFYDINKKRFIMLTQ